VAPVVISAEEVAAAEESYWSTVRREVAEQLRYPMGARRDGCQSRIMVRLEIAADGRLANAEPIPPPGNAALTRATLAAVRRAAPFPPPPDILTPPVRAELPVRFEIGK
jgi:protein TonB